MPETMAPPMPGAGAPPMAGGASAGPPGATAPATVAPDSAGLKIRGRVMVGMHLKGLVTALGLIGPTTEEGQDLAKVIATLSKSFGDPSPDVSQQEVKMMGARVPPVGQPTPSQGAAFQQMIKQKLGGMQGAGLGGPPASPPAA